MIDKIYKILFRFGKYLCHQKPERSFFIGSYQFPVCSRCTGILISFVISLFFIYSSNIPNIITSLILILPMFIDWLLQYLNIKESTNIRRLITGLIGGFGLSFTYYKIILLFIK